LPLYDTGLACSLSPAFYPPNHRDRRSVANRALQCLSRGKYMAPPLFIVVSRHSRDGAVAPRREVAFLSGSHLYVWADGVYLQARMKGAERNDYVISRSNACSC
jgi:hypothetical protein